MNFSDTPVLHHEITELQPLDTRHSLDLANAVQVGELWRTWYTDIAAPELMQAEVARRIQLTQEGTQLTWAVIDRASNKAIGMTGFRQLEPGHRRLEIGGTWLGLQSRGKGINAAAKYLLLSRAFEDLECIAVEFRTHWHNHESRTALTRMGARQDGVLRNHKIHANGAIRDTVIFSITNTEWPGVRYELLQRLERHLHSTKSIPAGY